MIDHERGRLVGLALLLLTTITAGTWYTKDPQSVYSENLTKHRRQFKVVKTATKMYTQTRYRSKAVYITPIHAVTDQLDYLLVRKKTVSEQVKYVRGYTIQAYTGGSREDAFKVKNKLCTHYAAITPEVTYDLPNYTVRLGKFLDKLEAYPVYAAIKKHIPQAIIRPIYFVNQPHIFNNGRATDQRHTVPLAPADSGHCPNKQD
jgi:hypothetical protein